MFAFVVLDEVFQYFFYLAKLMAVKNVSKMTHFVLGGMSNHNQCCMVDKRLCWSAGGG